MAESGKTERATPRRRQKAREQGQVARSRDLMASLATFTAVLLSASLAPGFAGQWGGLLRRTLGAAATTDWSSGPSSFAAAGLSLVRPAGLVLAASWAVALVAALAQGGLVFAPSALAPNLGRLSPTRRLEQLFSLPSVGRLVKSLVPGAAVVCLAIAVLERDWPALVHLPHLAVFALAGFSLGRMFEIAWKSALVLLAWSGADYLIERHRLEDTLRMSRQDIKDEYRETEGHPAVKARIRRLQRQARRRKMLEEVKRAAVVITNPDEFAVALAYDASMPAPKVVAKGRNLLAQQIKEIARWEGIALVENPPLAHTLYRAVEVGQSIPPKLYAVVAGILAAIYRAQQSAARAGQVRPTGPGSAPAGGTGRIERVDGPGRTGATERARSTGMGE